MKSGAFALAMLLPALDAHEQQPRPVIDMHLHAMRMDGVPPGAPACPGDQRMVIPTIDPREELDFSRLLSCDKPILAARDDADLRTQFHGALKRMVDAGFEKRIMFGSDPMYWADALGEAIRSIRTAPFLNDAQKRDILHSSAARFLWLSDAEIARHHRP